MTFTAHATARFDGALPDDLLPHIAAHAREADLQPEETETSLIVTVPPATVVMEAEGSGLRVRIDAVDAAALQNIRDYLLYILDHVAPGLAPVGHWQGDILRNRSPLNFCTATMRGIRRVGPNFLRVEMDCADTKRLKDERGMHFSLLLPPEACAPVWPQLDGNGRTVMPKGDDALHRAVYTFVDLDPDGGRFTFDVFEHDGGRAMTWTRTARPGDIVGISGPGSGDIPPGRDILIAGDETALPAIRHILEMPPANRRGHALLEIGTDDDICDLPRPEGITLTWLVRSRKEGLWDHLATAQLPQGTDRYVWIAAEKELVRKAKTRFRKKLGLGINEGYFAYYWEA